MTIEVRNLDHLGLVAGLIDEIGIVELINEQLGEHLAQKISAGQVMFCLFTKLLKFLTCLMSVYHY